MATMDLLGSYTASSSVSFIEITNIPQSYVHLIIEYTTKQNSAGFVACRLNGDSGSNYRTLFVNGTAWNNSLSNSTAILINDGINVTNSGHIFMPKYTDTSFYKQFRGYDLSNYIAESQNVWRNTSAVTAFRLLGGYNFESGSHISIYGLKQA